MSLSKNLRFLVLVIGSLVLLPCQFVYSSDTSFVPPYPTTFFSEDPQHPWNQLYGMLFLRPGLDGQIYGENEVDPLYWPETRYLLDGAVNKRAVKLLDGFNHGQAAGSMKDPIRRAWLQRQLWALFDHLVNVDIEAPSPSTLELSEKILQIMKNVALTHEAIATLPDNLVTEIANRDYPADFDPAQSEKPFLPSGLEADTDWVALGRADQSLLAPVHSNALSNRSVFTVYLNLAGGREATLSYLKKLHDQLSHPTANQLPQVPVFTKFALMRRALLINEAGEIEPSPIVESLQIRVMTDLVGTEALYFYLLNPTKLLQGKSSLIPLKKDDGVFDLALDPLMVTYPRDLLTLKMRGLADFNGTAPRMNCLNCHSAVGIYSMNSYRQLFDRESSRPPDLESDPAGKNEINRTIHKKESDITWKVLRVLFRDLDVRI
jgi:hypothetical protein